MGIQLGEAEKITLALRQGLRIENIQDDISFIDREGNWVIVSILLEKKEYNKTLKIKDLAILGFKNNGELCFKNDRAAKLIVEVGCKETEKIIKAYKMHREIIRRNRACR